MKATTPKLMSNSQDACKVTAILGPTNTGKTHLALERMLGHRSGIIGLPLRLLAREIYDKITDIKGLNAVALITGEEKIIPNRARYFVCTTESVPTDREVDFVALHRLLIAHLEFVVQVVDHRCLRLCDRFALHHRVTKIILQALLHLGRLFLR